MSGKALLSALIEPQDPMDTPSDLDQLSDHAPSMTEAAVDQANTTDNDIIDSNNSVVDAVQHFDQSIHGVSGEDAVMHEEHLSAESLHEPVPIVDRNYIRAFIHDEDAVIEYWHLQCLVLGDGSVSQSGHKLEEGKWYGSSELNGDQDAFREVDIDSLELSSRGQTTVVWSSGVLINGSRSKVPDESPVAVLRYTPRDEINAHLLRIVKYWLNKYRGAVLIVGGPLTRAPIASIENEFVREFGFVLQRGRLGRCVLDSIVNAIDRVAGRAVAIKAAQKINKLCFHFKDMGSVPKVVHDLKAGVHAVSVEILEENKFKWLVNKAKGTYMVRLEQCKIVDYVVVVDTCAGIIVDSAETFPIQLTEKTLRKSGGDSADKLRVKEVIQVVKQATP